MSECTFSGNTAECTAGSQCAPLSLWLPSTRVRVIAIPSSGAKIAVIDRRTRVIGWMDKSKGWATPGDGPRQPGGPVALALGKMTAVSKFRERLYRNSSSGIITRKT